MDKSILRKLEEWYADQCDGDWEHGSGVKIDTLDNPGWRVDIDLEGTELEDKELSEFKDNYDDEIDWMVCKKEGNKFSGNCGPNRLEDVLTFFIDWKNS